MRPNPSVKLTVQGWSPGGGLGTAMVFAVTSVIVGIREELLYRGVLINLLEPWAEKAGAVLLSTVVFVLYHYGALSIAPVPIIEVVSLSLVLGAIYDRSRSLAFVMALHFLYDGIWFLGPYLANPLPYISRVGFLLSAVVLVILWAARPDPALQPADKRIR